MIGLILFSMVGGQVPTSPATTNQEGVVQTPSDKPPTGGFAMTAADVEAFLDGILPQQLERENIAGATVAVVKDGKLLFSKGYGYSDVATKKPVLPDSTLFRPGSISKLFTWTAVMQMYEQGKLDLDADVNQYLDFKIPDAYAAPITLKHIMTHTAGFEEQVKDLFSVGNVTPNLGEYLKTHIPDRIYPPGTTPAYSNYATALAGYMVERVSGQPFNDYVAEHIFKPLQMNRSTFVQPLPSEMVSNMSTGYRLASDSEPVPFEVVVPFPAGSLSSTAADMSQFMLAHLQEGQLGGAQILKPETARLMHSRLFGLDPAANAMCYGFYEESRNGHRIIGHGGDTIAFHSDLHLIPDTGVGFYVSYNSGGKGEASSRTMVWEAFLDRYYPFTPTAASAPESAKQDAQTVSGNYEISRRSEGSFLKTASLLGQATVAANEDATITVSGLNDPDGVPKRWQAISPMTYRDVNGQDLLIFKPDATGNMQIVLPYPFMVFQRVGPWENGKILMPILVVSLLIMLLTLLLTPVAWLVRRHYGQRLEWTGTERWLRRGIWLVFVLDLFFVVALIGLLTYAMSNIEFLSNSTAFIAVQMIGIVGAVGTLLVLINAVLAWISPRWRIWGKLQATILALACIGFLWFAYAGNLLHITTSY
jgi:CubicO group peptidase (beta-lactamase class C family)